MESYVMSSNLKTRLSPLLQPAVERLGRKWQWFWIPFGNVHYKRLPVTCYLLGKLSIQERVEERDLGRRGGVNGGIKGIAWVMVSRFLVGHHSCWRECLHQMFCLKQWDPHPWTVQGDAFAKQGSTSFNVSFWPLLLPSLPPRLLGWEFVSRNPGWKFSCTFYIVIYANPEE